MQGEKAIRIICSRFKWVTDTQIRILNESNIDCLFDICTDDPEDKDIDARYLKLISVVKVDNELQNRNKLNSNHYYHH